MSSVLNDIKSLLGIEQDYNAFDDELVLYINGAMIDLYELAKIDSLPQITGAGEQWSDFGIDGPHYATFVALKVRLVFDPPQNSFVTRSIEEQVKEAAWRIAVL